MFEVDRISVNAKKRIVDLLSQIISVEYSFIINIPRLIDRLWHVDGIPKESIPKDLVQLSMDSARHLSLTAHIIRVLGGEPEWMVCVDDLPDSSAVLLQAVGIEREAKTLYLKAAKIAEHGRTKGLSGLLWKLFTFGGFFSSDPVSAKKVIKTLRQMSEDEQKHLEIVEEAIPMLKIPANKVKEAEERRTEKRIVAEAIESLWDDIKMAYVPSVYNYAAHTACNDMALFPACAAATALDNKQDDPNGDDDPDNNRQGYALYGCRKAKRNGTTETRNYITISTTKYYYTCETNGKVRQWIDTAMTTEC